MKSLGCRVLLVTFLLALAGVGCSNGSNQAVDASAADVAPMADAGADRVADAPPSGAEVGKDAATAGGPEVPSLCPGLDKFGNYAPIVAGDTPFPEGVELLVPSGDATAMVVTDSELYWANKRSIHRLTLGDGVDKIILDRSQLGNTMSDLALDSTNLYFTEIGSDNGYRVAKMAPDGSGAPITLGGNSSPWYIAVAGDYVYYFDANIREIDRVPIVGGTVTPLVGNVDPESFLLADGHIYFKDQVTPTQVSLLSISVDARATPAVDGGTAGSGGLVTLVSNNRGFSAPAYAGGNLYYGDGGNLVKLPAAGGSPSVVVGLPAGDWVSTVATGGRQLYWANGPTSPSYCSSILRAPLDGSTQTTLVRAIEAPSSLALNATHLFILTRGGQILRVPRTGGTTNPAPSTGAQPLTQMRFMQVWLNGGNKATFDLWTRLNDGSWYSVYRALTYGEMTDFIQVPNGKGYNTNIWFVPMGDDPADHYLSMTDSMNFKLAESDTGKHTVFSFFKGSSWSHQLVTDADPAVTPPDGWAYVAFTTYAIAGANPVMDYGSSDGCVDRAKQTYYQPMRPGSYQFTIYAGDQTNCQGSVLATTPSVDVANGDVWQLYAMGDATNGYALKPVKMAR
jgi:hypothetical protein